MHEVVEARAADAAQIQRLGEKLSALSEASAEQVGLAESREASKRLELEVGAAGVGCVACK